MKKVILFFAAATVITLMMGCDPMQNAWIWTIKNDTQQPLKFKFPYFDSYQISNVMPGESITIYESNTDTNTHDNLDFNYYFGRSVDTFGEDIYWQMLSEDDEILKTWSYSNIDNSDQRLFDESSWTYEFGNGSRFIETIHIWTFEILPEDIQSTN